jgi:rubrerythrin
MRLALLSEFGAHVVYSRLATCVEDRELRGVLAELAEEEVRQIERLRSLMSALGDRPRRRSIRRWLAARALVSCRRLFGARFALRVCLDAEWTVSRWYAKYADYLNRVGQESGAQECQELALIKRRHSRVLQAWVDLGAR